MKQRRNGGTGFVGRLTGVLLAAAVVCSSFGSTVFAAAPQATAQQAAPALSVSDGTILHAWSWSFKNIQNHMKEIADAGYTAVQTSPASTIYDEAKGNLAWDCGNNATGGHWWWIYQPTDYRVGNYLVGTEQDLKDLCATAKQYGVKVIVDVVANHTSGHEAALGTGLTQAAGGSTEGTLYHTHGKTKTANYSDRQSVIQDQMMSGLWDLNTENKGLQDYLIQYLKTLENDGVSGFRWDGAKHIGLPGENGGGDFWSRMLGQEVKDGKDIFNYGEVLEDDGSKTDNLAGYAQQDMDITASKYGENLRNAISEEDLSVDKVAANGTRAGTGVSDSKLVKFVETHDNYSDGSYKTLNDTQVALGWAVIAARKDSAALFLDRPAGSSSTSPWGTNQMGGEGDTAYKDPAVAGVNRFRTAMAGQDESLHNQGNSVLLIDRGNKGTCIVNAGDSAVAINTTTKLADGTYTDQIGGSTFTVTQGTITGTVAAKSAAAVYTPANTLPAVSASQANGSFAGSLGVTLHCANTANAVYSIDGGTAQTFTDGTVLTLGADTKVGGTVTLTLTAGSGDTAVTRIYTYTKSGTREVKAGTATLKLPGGWSAPTCYMYHNNAAGKNETNGDWPGVAMTKNADGTYSAAMPAGWASANVIFASGNQQVPGSGQSGFSMTSSQAKLYADGTWQDDTITPKPVTHSVLTIHYHRFDNNYTGWNLWCWPIGGGDGSGVNFTSEDKYGKVATKTFSGAVSKAGFIVRLSKDGNDWADKDVSSDRTVELNGDKDIWLLQGDPKVYTAQPETAPALHAFQDGDRKLTVSADGGFTAENLKNIKVSQNGSEVAASAAGDLVDGRAKTAVVTTAADLDVTQSYTISCEGFTNAFAAPRRVLDESKYYYKGSDLGASYQKDKTEFRLWAPVEQDVQLLLFDKAADTQPSQTLPMSKAENGTWKATATGDLNGKYYLYETKLFVNGQLTAYQVNDPYACGAAANSGKSLVYDHSQTVPTGWSHDQYHAQKNNVDAVVYEMHVRDYTISQTSGVAQADRGKYTGLTRSGTKSAEGETTGLDHLKDLGVTHVELLPTYDYGTGDETQANNQYDWYNWGYDPVLYNTPEGSYASNANGTARQSEYKQMVQTLHQNGMGVVFDAVFNHTYQTGTQDKSVFDRIVPGYYYRTDDMGNYVSGSGCGNDVASENPMVRKLIVDSSKYWIQEYHLDGMRFDLMGLLDKETMQQVYAEGKKLNPSFMLFGEGWNLATKLTSGQQMTQANAAGTGIGCFNDGIRDDVKGTVFDDSKKGFAQGGTDYNYERFLKELQGAAMGPDSLPLSTPNETINYACCHDNMNLWDKIAKSNASDSEAARLKMDALTASVILTAQGVPFFAEGDEFARSKNGNGNSYNDNSANVNPIDWSLKAKNKSLYNYYKGLIALRKNHPAFRMTDSAMVSAHMKFLGTDSADKQLIAYKLTGAANGDSWQNIFVAYNGSSTDKTVAVPGSWNVVVSGSTAGTAVLATVSDKVTVPAYSTVVMYDRTVGQGGSSTQPATDTSVTVPSAAVQAQVRAAVTKAVSGTTHSVAVTIAAGSKTVTVDAQELAGQQAYLYTLENGTLVLQSSDALAVNSKGQVQLTTLDRAGSSTGTGTQTLVLLPASAKPPVSSVTGTVQLVQGSTLNFTAAGGTNAGFASGNGKTVSTLVYQPLGSQPARCGIYGCGAVGQKAGVYLNGVKLFTAEIVKAPYRSDTTVDITTKKTGQTYWFRIFPDDTAAAVSYTAGNGSVLSTRSKGRQADGSYLFGFQITGKAGTSSGIYVNVNGVSCCVFHVKAA